jgi:hypothetical protein
MMMINWKYLVYEIDALCYAVAGPENVDSGNEEQMTENTPMTNTLEKTGGGKIFRLWTLLCHGC